MKYPRWLQVCWRCASDASLPAKNWGTASLVSRQTSRRRTGAINTNLRLHLASAASSGSQWSSVPRLCLHGQARGSAQWPDLLPPWSQLQRGHILGPPVEWTAQLGLHACPGGWHRWPKKQQLEVLKQDFVSLVDHLLVTRKQLIIAGQLTPPRYGDVTTSRLHQLHPWLKGYCLTKSIPYVDNFAAFLNRPCLFKGTVCNNLSNLLTQINVFVHNYNYN